MLAQTVDGRAQTEVQTRAEVSVLLQSLSKRPAVRRECLRSLQAIFAEPVPGAALSPTPVPVPAKNGFWNKLFIVERADGGDYGLFALAPAAEAQSEQTAPPAFGRRESAHGQRRNPQHEPRTMRICEPLDLLVL